MRIISINLILLLCFPLVADHHQINKTPKKSSKVKVSVTEVSKNIHMLSTRGGNIGMSTGSDGILLIDSQFLNINKKIRAKIRKIAKGPIKFLINTHFHGGHTGSNAKLGKKSIIVAHENVKKRLSEDQLLKLSQKTAKKQSKSRIPTVTFRDAIKIHFNDQEIEILHFAKGHTDGDSIVLFHGSQVAHLGDHFFAGKFPFIDMNAGGDVLQYHRNVKDILKIIPPHYKIIPGHGPLSSHADYIFYEQMISDSIEHIKDEKNIGTDIGKITLAKVITKFKGVDKGLVSEKFWIKLIMDSL